MPLIAVGINHRTAPVAIRERVAFAPERQGDALRDLLRHGAIQEAVILSTCNRTEIYAATPEATPATLIEWIARWHGLSEREITPWTYTHLDKEMVRHLLRVTSGLDSMILGEPQILGQAKDAWVTASGAGALGRILERLFQHSFTVAKEIRTDTAIGVSAVSVAYAAIVLARRIFGDLATRSVLLIGAGDTIELAARHLIRQGTRNMTIANRGTERATALAAQFDARAIPLAGIGPALAGTDIVISSTASPDFIVRRDQVMNAFRQRRHRPMLIVDLAVPRDVEPEVASIEDVYLYTVDDLREVIEENLRSRSEAAQEAERIVEIQSERFIEWLRSLDAVATIRALRGKAQADSAVVLQRALRLLAAGKPPEEVLSRLSHTLTNRLLHTPSIALRRAAAAGREEALREARQLFGLDAADDEP